MAMMHNSVKDINFDLYSEKGYPSPPIRSVTEALPISDADLHSEIDYPSASMKSRT